MAIDYVVDYGCEPKDLLTTAGILGRLKGREQARQVIQVYREAGDDRPTSEMGFEFTRNTPEGEEQTETVLIDDLLATSAQLDPLAHHCSGCPANVKGEPFGCFGRIPYPISDHGERWLLLQLPQPHEAPLVWTLLGEHLRELNEQAAEVQAIREGGTYFESAHNPRRKLGEIALSGNNLFYLLFMGGHLTPARAAVTMLFFNVIPRNIDAPDMYKLTPPPPDADERYPFQFQPDPDVDDKSISAFKAFFHAMYAAWRLNVNLLIDA
jgi:hypothetical protein